MVARSLAILHTCIYDAWATYDTRAIPTRPNGLPKQDQRSDQRRAPTNEANEKKAISFAAYRALVDLFPTEVATFSTLMSRLGYDPQDTSTDARTPSGVGNVAAEAVLAYRHLDGSNQLHGYFDSTGYVPVNAPYPPANTPAQIADPDQWQPLVVRDRQGVLRTQTYVAPHWGGVTPFALTSGSQFRPSTGPARFTAASLTDPTDPYRLRSQQILDLSAGLTDTHKVIAEYWADGPGSELPPGHWCLLAQFIAQRDRHDLERDVKMFFVLTNAMFDASIACWEAKRFWTSVRPITSIHYLFAGQQIRAWGGPYQGTQTFDGKDWLPYQVETLVTPAFPEYVSDHSTFSRTAAETLTRFTGSPRFGASFTQRAHTSRIEPLTTPAQDVTLSWPTFGDAAEQAGLSRRYGGIHFLQGDLMGQAMGVQVAAQAWEKAQRYFRGTA